MDPGSAGNNTRGLGHEDTGAALLLLAALDGLTGCSRDEMDQTKGGTIARKWC